MRKADAIKFYGTVAKLGRALDIRPNAISMHGEILPKALACELEVITAGALRVDWSLYPRKYPLDPPSKATPKRSRR